MAWFKHGTSRIYYEESGSGEPVLLLPGWADNLAEHIPMREALAANYRVIAADLPGSGRSEPLPRAYSSTYYQEDARAFAALLEDRAAVPAHLIGFSDGGEVALLMAELSPGLARSLLAEGAAGAIDKELLPALDELYDIVDSPTPPLHGFRRHLIDSYGEANAHATAQSFARAGQAIIEGGGDISLSKVGNITCPVLLIAGEHDEFVSPQILSRLASRIPNSEFLVVEGAGHRVQEDHLEWLIQTTLEWVEKH
jgi:valacyclovir hydrolase